MGPGQIPSVEVAYRELEMSLVAFLKGINVGGHRSLRPKVLASELSDLDVVSVGAAGTFVVRKQVSAETLRGAIASRVPFTVNVIICQGIDILQLATNPLLEGREAEPEIVQFVGVGEGSLSPEAAIPRSIPNEDDWKVRVLGSENRFILGVHRREMKAIRYLGELEKALGASMTIGTWGTILKTAKVVGPQG